jgi:hypothetical protein
LAELTNCLRLQETRQQKRWIAEWCTLFTCIIQLQPDSRTLLDERADQTIVSAHSHRRIERLRNLYASLPVCILALLQRWKVQRHQWMGPVLQEDAKYA